MNEEQWERLTNCEKLRCRICDLDVSESTSDKLVFELANIEDEIFEQRDEIERLNNIIDTILDFPFFKEECPLNFGFNEKELETKAQDVFYEDEWCEKNCDDTYKKCWLKYFDKLKELKEGR